MVVFIQTMGSVGHCKTVSDRLVQNLDCQKLNLSNLKKSIDKNFSAKEFHLPLQNYGIPYMGSEIANCWSLSRTQRLLFYLGRSENDVQNKKLAVLNLVRGSEPYISDEQIKEWTQLDYDTFWWPEDEQLRRQLLQEWLKPINQNLDAEKIIKRSFKDDLEYFQKRRFGDFIRNGKYIIRSGARAPRINRQTVAKLKFLLQQNELPMIIIRENRMAQHVVIIKSFQETIDSKGVNEIKFTVYDSNTPWSDNELRFTGYTDHFYAPKIMTGLVGVRNPNAAMGVFIVDENERAYVLNKLFKKYQNICQQNN